MPALRGSGTMPSVLLALKVAALCVWAALPLPLHSVDVLQLGPLLCVSNCPAGGCPGRRLPLPMHALVSLQHGLFLCFKLGPCLPSDRRWLFWTTPPISAASAPSWRTALASRPTRASSRWGRGCCVCFLPLSMRGSVHMHVPQQANESELEVRKGCQVGVPLA